MQLTKIVLNPASRLARADLADAYEMHSTLSRAFATADGEPVSRFLWRQESTRPGEPGFVLVQSSAAGDWQALRNAKPDWAAGIESREWHPARVLRVGQQLQFRLRANPTVTREAFKHTGRLTQAIQSGKLFEEIGEPPLSRATDRAMICGSPAMLKETAEMLDAAGFSVSPSAGVQGDYVFERAFVER